MNRAVLKRALVAICVLAAAMFFVPRGLALLALNYAQLGRLHGSFHPTHIAAYQQALRLAPSYSHLRLQAIEGLWLAGDAPAAATSMGELAGRGALEPQAAGLQISALLAQQREREALGLYAVAKPPLPAGVAAGLLVFALEQGVALTPDGQRTLLAYAFGLDPQSPTFAPLGATLGEPEFWASDMGLRTRQALRWRSGRGGVGLQQAGETGSVTAARVGALLGQPELVARLGPELVTNGGFERLNGLTVLPLAWEESFMSTGDPWNLAAFVAGVDVAQPFAGGGSLRIDGLLIERLPEREAARAGFLQPPLTLSPGGPYIISFMYRTEQAADSTAGVYFYPYHQIFFEGANLPQTAGVWKRVTIIDWNRSGGAIEIYPLLRSFGEGSVWFDDFSARRLSPGLMPGEPIIVIDEP